MLVCEVAISGGVKSFITCHVAVAKLQLQTLQNGNNNTSPGFCKN